MNHFESWPGVGGLLQGEMKRILLPWFSLVDVQIMINKILSFGCILQGCSGNQKDMAVELK